MKVLKFWAALLLVLFALSGFSLGQTAAKSYRLGILSPSSGTVERIRAYMLPALALEGFVEGRNLDIEALSGTTQELLPLAQQLLAGKPDAIVAAGSAAISAIRAYSGTVPIVGSMIGTDPILEGFAVSLAKPGGNVTGVVMLAPELDAKRLELLRETIPNAHRIATLATSEARERANLLAMQQAATTMGIELLVVYAGSPADYPAALAAARSGGATALAIVSAPEFFSNAATLTALALEAGLPTVCEWRSMAEQGCLLGYGPDLVELQGRIAHYLARIFRGAKPGELPIERPEHYQFAINLRTAKALGLTIPPSVLARADDLIE
jgi:putative ABC transport system substrate-binding protein